MRTIYENYRGFKISKEESTYNAISSDHVIFSRWQLSQVLDTVDQYVDIMDPNTSTNSEFGLPQN
ncbi:hypothetical protein P5G65_20030 [Paenibacillus chondroitinus]|uniref:Uncharacterized protein n=1 Tax=Paenibacillus chondroitinus TaxID=59842 RepID=A0ABU6DEL4_9BACL|nr:MULTISPECIES: hypothetical protein [Paenibacillus]MCY9658578.1 hypothetical protein [Paenibacillus anseongense]MEB4796197.1 hypothetical protein [Paenibacillus chondroitinus]